MANPIVAQNDGVFTQAKDLLAGLAGYETEVGFSHVTQAIMQNSIITAEAAVRAYGELRVAKKNAVLTQQAADEAVTLFIRNARRALMLRFGESFSEDWIPTGFPNQSIAVPRTMADRQALARALQNYFANHAAYEMPGINATAVEAGVRFNALADARSAVNDLVGQLAASKVVRDQALAQLRQTMRDCITELGQLIEDDDTRWYAFGLNPPAAPETPEAVDGLVLTHAGPGNVQASWNGAPRAGRYRVLKQIVGVDGEMIAVETVYDTQFTFTGLTAGQTLRVQIVAANEAGVAVPSETVEIVVQ